MANIYLDNASTSFPKPECCAQAVYDYMTKNGSNINRGGYNFAYSVEEKIYEIREALCEYFHGEDPSQVVFTANITTSLNILLKGFLRPGDHVLVSSMEHNAVMRPLTQLSAEGVEFTRVPCDAFGQLEPSILQEYLQPNTRLVMMTHASNVCGTLLPIKEIGSFCAANNLRFFVDSAQTAGIVPIDMQKMHIDALAFTGHKGLMGPQGIGGFILRKDIVKEINPLLSGGTGSISHTEDIPSFMPDRFEPGTMNIPGILGLGAALQYIRSELTDSILSHDLSLARQFLEGLSRLESQGLLQIIGKKDIKERVAVVSIQMLQIDIAEAARLLDEKYHIQTRVGLHCAPSAHKTLGTYPTGTLRFSFGVYNTEEDVAYTLKALEEICHGI